MNEDIKLFKDAYESDEGRDLLALGEKIKKLDKSNDKRLMLIILLAVISMTLLGYISWGLGGSIGFFCITVIASFWLFYSSKKNLLLKYLTFYRTRVPKLIASARGIEVKAEEVPDSKLVSSLSDRGKLAYRMCHRYGDIYIGFAKFMEKGEPVLQGLLYYAEGEGDMTEELKRYLNCEFSDFVIKAENGRAVLFIPGVEDYLNGRVEMKDDLTFLALLKQYDYYLLGENFKAALNGKPINDTAIFHEDE